MADNFRQQAVTLIILPSSGHLAMGILLKLYERLTASKIAITVEFSAAIYRTIAVRL